MPWNESQRMQAPIRLVPSSAKQLSRPSAWTVSRSANMAISDQDQDEADGGKRRGADDELRHLYEAIAGHRRLDHADCEGQNSHAQQHRHGVQPWEIGRASCRERV